MKQALQTYGILLINTIPTVMTSNVFKAIYIRKTVIRKKLARFIKKTLILKFSLLDKNTSYLSKMIVYNIDTSFVFVEYRPFLELFS